MDGLGWLAQSWQFLSRDVSLVGGFQSPMLSWLGAGGIVALCLWHSVFLVRGVLQIRQAFTRLHATVARLVRARQQTSKEWIVIPALAKKQAQVAQAPGARRDLDDLQELDRVMRSEWTVAGNWLSYRKTFAVEQSSWFIEPTVHTERSAAEFFPFEALCSTHLNVRFYQQLPSFMTGMGLMFTFLAILIGLSKLHANGSQIEGIQGLINGLAGKFVTSVVGLACANVFMLLEKSLWYRLAKHHRQFVSLLDAMFPHQVKDQSIQSGTALGDRTIAVAGSFRNDSANQLVEAVQQRLGSTVAALTSVSQSLAAIGTRNGLSKQEALASDIGKEVQKALRPLLDPLLEAIRDLNHSVEKQRLPVQLSHWEMDKMFDQLRNHLDGDHPVATTAERPRQGKTSGGWRLSGLKRGPADKTEAE
jgi:hypothetical protein